MKSKNIFPLFLVILGIFLCSLSGHKLYAAAPNLSNVVWLGTNVSSWKQTATLSSVTVDSSKVTLNYNKATVWPGAYRIGEATDLLNANPWIFVNRNGTWYAATWEWLRFGQTVKGTYAVNGDHIKIAPLDNFYPVKGEEYGFMVSGLVRNADSRNVYERSNVVMVKWPLETRAPCSAPPTISFEAHVNDDSASPNRPTLTWSILTANTASISPLVGDIIPTQGSATVSINKTTEFILTAVNSCGESTKKVTWAYNSSLSGVNLLLREK